MPRVRWAPTSTLLPEGATWPSDWQVLPTSGTGIVSYSISISTGTDNAAGDQATVSSTAANYAISHTLDAEEIQLAQQNIERAHLNVYQAEQSLQQALNEHADANLLRYQGESDQAQREHPDAGLLRYQDEHGLQQARHENPVVNHSINPYTQSLEARERARALLLRYLDDDQREEYEQSSQFKVEINERRFLLVAERTGNVLELGDDDRTLARYCIHPSGGPIEDQLLCQMMMLETDEERFFEIANRW